MNLRLPIFCTLLALCLGAHGEEQVLNVYNWADFIGEHTIADFEAEYGIKVNYDIYDSSSMVDAKLMAGRAGYDVVVHSAGYAARLQKAGIFQPLDHSKQTNWANLDPTLLETYATSIETLEKPR